MKSAYAVMDVPDEVLELNVDQSRWWWLNGSFFATIHCFFLVRFGEERFLFLCPFTYTRFI